MRILITVLVIVGTAVTHARPPRRTPTLKSFLEAMNDPHLFDLPPAENRSIDDFAEYANLVIWDATLQAENLYHYLNSTKFNGNVSDEVRATVAELFNNFTQKLNDAHTFFYETYDQVNSTAVYDRVPNALDKNYLNQRREELLREAKTTVTSILEGHATYRELHYFWQYSGVRRLLLDLVDLQKYVRDLYKPKYNNPFACNEKHLRVLYQYFSWNANGRLLSEQELDQKLAEEAALQKQRENEEH